MKNRFDLEQELMECWQITADIKTLTEAVCDGLVNTDEITNILIGLEQLYNIKFSKTFATFEKLIATGKL